jgi:hypothetical protein
MQCFYIIKTVGYGLIFGKVMAWRNLTVAVWQQLKSVKVKDDIKQ